MGVNQDNPTIKVIERLGISDETASEVSGELTNGKLGLMRDMQWGNGYFLVEWHEADDA